MKRFEIAGLPPDELNSFLAGTHSDPFRILGPHRLKDGLVIRAFRPDAQKIDIVLDRQRKPASGGEPSDVDGKAREGSRAGERVNQSKEAIAAEKIHRDGFFCATLPEATRDLDYHLRVTSWDGSELVMRDPYGYGPILGEVDLHLFVEGQHWQIYEKFGAHLRTMGDTAGVHFAVWAPNAQRVSVIGDFNGWDGRVHPMRLLMPNGIWEIFIPDLPDGEKYKFEIRTRSSALLTKSDPFAVAFEVPPHSASVVRDISRYLWRDDQWMSTRDAQRGWYLRPMAIYEVHLGSWARVPEQGN